MCTGVVGRVHLHHHRDNASEGIDSRFDTRKLGLPLNLMLSDLGAEDDGSTDRLFQKSGLGRRDRQRDPGRVTAEQAHHRLTGADKLPELDQLLVDHRVERGFDLCVGQILFCLNHALARRFNIQFSLGNRGLALQCLGIGKRHIGGG